MIPGNSTFAVFGIYLSQCSLFFFSWLSQFKDGDIPTGEEISDDMIEYDSPEQLGNTLVTLSTLPESRWKNLLNLDIIKVTWHNIKKLLFRTWSCFLCIIGLFSSTNGKEQAKHLSWRTAFWSRDLIVLCSNWTFRNFYVSSSFWMFIWIFFTAGDLQQAIAVCLHCCSVTVFLFWALNLLGMLFTL